MRHLLARTAGWLGFAVAWAGLQAAGASLAANVAPAPTPPASAAPMQAVAGDTASPQAAIHPLTGNPIAAVWKERRIDFVYPGLTARYSCDGLRDKVRAMLLDLGARRDVKIVAIGCDADDRLRVNSAQPSLSIVFSAPALPDPAAKPLRVGDLAAIDARFEAFTITSDAFRNMGIGDCELVQEFARQILPKLATFNVRQDIACVPMQQSGSRFLIRGLILKTLPRVEQADQQPTGIR